MLLAVFCLRLATGLAASLLLLRPTQVNPRFYRVQFLTVLGLFILSASVGWQHLDSMVLGAMFVAAIASFAGSIAWSLEGAPAGTVAAWVVSAASASALLLWPAPSTMESSGVWVVLNQLTSALLLGVATSCMLMGHSYLIAPTMSLTPLLTLLAALAAILLGRGIVAAVGLYSWTADHSLSTLDDVTLILPLRWGFGFIGPLVLGWMAWRAARIRSTQSATGILYVAVIFCFLGELTSQVLAGYTGRHL